MSHTNEDARVPADKRASVAVDLGAESCRVSLLRWNEGKPVIELMHRFANTPRESNGGLRWDLKRIEAGLDEGLERCAQVATEGVRSIAVDGWAVDYVRIDAEGRPLADPFCYRDERTIQSEAAVHQRISPARLRAITGIQSLRINTLYQLYADQAEGLPEGERWLNLPEYILFRWGGKPVAEYTNATHTEMVELTSQRWSSEVFSAVGFNPSRASAIVKPGAIVGKLRGRLAALPAFRDTVLIAPACHDTASAIAGIPAAGDDWAYISSGTWSLVGALIPEPRNNEAVFADNFTNLGGVGGQYCFHKNVNGMWLIQQCLQAWSEEGSNWTIPELIAAAECQAEPTHLLNPAHLLNVDEPDLLLAGHMPQRINAQRASHGLPPLADPPAIACLIFHSLAARYAEVLSRVAFHSGKKLKRLFVVGGASRNEFLNRLIHQATGLEVLRGSPESSTIGNFAIQLAALENPSEAPDRSSIAKWAALLNPAL